MKRLIKLLIGTVFSLALLSCLLPGTEAAAISGSGTVESPYVITSAAELQAVNDDLDAYYVLGNNISLSGQSFEPLGNEWDGPFTGTLDGKGFTVSYLTVNRTDLKYAGLFGYMEGTVQNLKLDNINISGGRYAGGVAGAVGVGGLITDCEVLSGSVSVSGSPMEMAAGGITGLCEGTVTRCSNGASVMATHQAKVDNYAGGIIGYLRSDITVEQCHNSGYVEAATSSNQDSNHSYSYAGAGGIIGRIENYRVQIIGCANSAAEIRVTNGHDRFIGGIVGFASISEIVIEQCNNSSTIDSYNTYYGSSGGIIGHGSNSDISLLSCENSGKITGRDSGGIAGYISSGTTNIDMCKNYGTITGKDNYSGGTGGSAGGILGYCYADASSTISNSINNGNVYGYRVGGIAGYINGSVILSINNGTITHSADTTRYGGVGAICRYGSAVDCVNTGTVYDFNNTIDSQAALEISNNKTEGMAALEITPNRFRISDGTSLYCNELTGSGYTLEELKDPNTYPASWNMGTDWIIDPEWNSGLPLPAGVPYRPLSDSVLFLNVGESADLKAQFEVRQWGSDDTSVATCANGKVTATGVGATVISAWSADGERANCVVYVYDTRDTVNFSQASYGVKANESLNLTTDIDPDDPQGQIWRSSDTSVATVDSNGRVTAIKTGKVTITVELALSGATGSCEVVVDPADVTRVSLSSLSVNVGDSKQVTVTFTPSNSAAELTWQTGDASVATVENGVVTGHKVGSTTITATTAGGISGSCTVTVKEPSTSVSLDVNELTLEVGMTHMLTATVEPDGTTDSLTWSSSSSSIASVNSSGLVTANRAGTALITVKTTSGQIATCQVTVRNKTVLPTGISISQTDARMAIGESIQLSATIEPSNTTMKDVAWSSSDPDIVSVNNTGVIKALSSGSAEIRAETENGLYDVCQVKVAVASSAGFVVMDARAVSGKTTETAVHIVKNPGIAAFSVDVEYDSEVLTPVSVEAGDCLAIGSLTSNIDSIADGEALHITWYSSEDVTANGRAFTITWNTAGEMQEIPITLGFSREDICNASKEEVGFSVQPGAVHILDREIGDIYYDNAVNMKDIVYFARWFNGQETLDANQQNAADVFYDDSLDVKDLTALAQLLNSEMVDSGSSAINLMSVGEVFKVTVSDAQLSERGDAVFAVSGLDCPGVAAFRFNIAVPDGYVLVDVQPGEDLPEAANLTFNAETGIISWYSDETCILNGNLFEVQIHTDDRLPEYGELSLEYIPEDFFQVEGYIPVEVSITPGKLSGETHVAISDMKAEQDGNVEFYIFSNGNETVTAIIAYYDNGRMVNNLQFNIEVEENEPSYSNIAIYTERQWDTVKVFLIDPETYEPLTAAAYAERE